MCWVMPPASPATTLAVADLVEQRGLAVVDVTHDRDDRRAGFEEVFVVVVAVVEHRLQLDLLLLARLDEQQVGAELQREQLHLLVGQAHRDGHHLAVLHQEPDDVGRQFGSAWGRTPARTTPLDDDVPSGTGASVAV